MDFPPLNSTDDCGSVIWVTATSSTDDTGRTVFPAGINSTDDAGEKPVYPYLPGGAEPANGWPGGFVPGPGPAPPPPPVPGPYFAANYFAADYFAVNYFAGL